MKKFKEERKSLKESFIHFIKVITWQEYRDLKAEWEKQNTQLDKVHGERDHWKKKHDDLELEYQRATVENLAELDKIKKLIKDLEDDHSNEIKDLKEKHNNEIKELKNKLKKEEEKRKTKDTERKAANKDLKKALKVISDQEGKIAQLQELNDILKNHRRAPDIEEIKDYTLGRKRKKCEKKS